MQVQTYFMIPLHHTAIWSSTRYGLLGRYPTLPSRHSWWDAVDMTHGRCGVDFSLHDYKDHTDIISTLHVCSYLSEHVRETANNAYLKSANAVAPYHGLLLDQCSGIYPGVKFPDSLTKTLSWNFLSAWPGWAGPKSCLDALGNTGPCRPLTVTCLDHLKTTGNSRRHRRPQES